VRAWAGGPIIYDFCLMIWMDRCFAALRIGHFAAQQEKFGNGDDPVRVVCLRCDMSEVS
jgi:hypothetical protein